MRIKFTGYDRDGQPFSVKFTSHLHNVFFLKADEAVNEELIFQLRYLAKTLKNGPTADNGTVQSREETYEDDE
jgi:hypothetical protein